MEPKLQAAVRSCDVVLVVPPFAGLDRPSIAAHLLQGAIQDREGLFPAPGSRRRLGLRQIIPDGRLLLSVIFSTSAISKSFGWAGNVAYMSANHLPLIPLLLAAALLIEALG